MILTINNSVDELGKVQAFTAKLAYEWQLTDKIKFNLDLIFDEIVSNIIFYAYDKEEEQKINIEIESIENFIFLTISDKGKPFNPLIHTNENIQEKNIDNREVGGLGIHFVKQLVDSIEYKREDEKNVLMLKISK